MNKRRFSTLVAGMVLAGLYAPAAYAHGGSMDGGAPWYMAQWPAYATSALLGGIGYLIMVWDPKQNRQM